MLANIHDEVTTLNVPWSRIFYRRYSAYAYWEAGEKWSMCMYYVILCLELATISDNPN